MLPWVCVAAMMSFCKGSGACLTGSTTTYTYITKIFQCATKNVIQESIPVKIERQWLVVAGEMMQEEAYMLHDFVPCITREKFDD